MINIDNKTKLYNIIAALIFLLGIGAFSFMGIINWLPPLCLIVGLSLALRQMLLGFHFDALVIVILFGACFFSSFLTLFARIFLPTFLILGTIYYIVRQFYTVKEKIVIKASDIKIEKNEESTSQTELKP